MLKGDVCQPDPLHACKHCTIKKQRCSLMPITKDGRPDRSKVKPEQIREYRLCHCKYHLKAGKGKQPAHGREQSQEVSGLGASPSTMLSALNIESNPSDSAGTDSNILPSTPSASPSPAAAAAIPQAQLFVEPPVPPPPPLPPKLPLPSSVPSPPPLPLTPALPFSSQCL